MIMTTDGYTLIQYPNQNKIMIYLPQTKDTITNSVTPIVDRKKELTQGQEIAVLQMVSKFLKIKERVMIDCNTCVHKDEPWDSEACDGCCRADSRYEPKNGEKP